MGLKTTDLKVTRGFCPGLRQAFWVEPRSVTALANAHLYVLTYSPQLKQNDVQSWFNINGSSDALRSDTEPSWRLWAIPAPLGYPGPTSMERPRSGQRPPRPTSWGLIPAATGDRSGLVLRVHKEPPYYAIHGASGIEQMDTTIGTEIQVCHRYHVMHTQTHKLISVHRLRRHARMQKKDCMHLPSIHPSIHPSSLDPSHCGPCGPRRTPGASD